MSDDRSTFETTRARLEDIVTQVRRKDVSLEQSLDMLEEAVRLVNQCNELIDQTSFRAPSEGTDVGDVAIAVTETDSDGDGAVDVVEVVQVLEVDGEVVVDVVDTLDTDGDGEADVRVETVSVHDADAWGAEDAWADAEPEAGPNADEAPAVPEDDARE
jgi:exodeoxyribonuclease VII small subunit